MFLDRVKIYIKAGQGGNGKTSFHTEKYGAVRSACKSSGRNHLCQELGYRLHRV